MSNVVQLMDTPEYVKRLAKKIKKAEGVPHHVALDLAASQLGYNNWKHFLNLTKEVVDRREEQSDFL